MRLMTALLGLAIGCGTDPVDERVRQQAAEDLAYEVIMPALYEAAKQASPLSLTTDMQRFTSMTEPFRLANAQRGWRDARAAWKRTEAFGFGPATTYELAEAIDHPVVDGAAIEALLASPGPIDANVVAALPPAHKGYHALEYLLFHPGGDAEVLALFRTSNYASRRRQLLVALAQDIARNTQLLQRAWDNDYLAVFAAPGVDNPEFPDPAAALETVLEQSQRVAGFVGHLRLGTPSGLVTGSARPELAESVRSDNSVHDMVSSLRGIQDIYLGTRAGSGTKGLAQLVAQRDRRADDATRRALATAIAAVEAIPLPYREAMIDGRPEIAIAFHAVQGLQRALVEHVAPALE